MTRPALLTGRERKQVSVFSIFFSIVIAIICVLFLFEIWFLRRFTPVRVDGSSMLMTLQNSDWLYADAEARPQRGDIVIIYVKDYKNEYGQPLFPSDIHGEPVTFIIKRVIALAGDEVYGRDNRIYLKKKGETEFSSPDEPYAYYDPLQKIPLSFASEAQPVAVKEGEIFVMGDNRLHSQDSTEVGVLDLKDVTGVVPGWAVENKEFITEWENFRDKFRN